MRIFNCGIVKSQFRDNASKIWKRRAGKSKNNFYSLYDYAMIGITSYSKVVMRLATFAGFIIGGLSMVAAIVYLIRKSHTSSFFHIGFLFVSVTVCPPLFLFPLHRNSDVLPRQQAVGQAPLY